MEVHHSGLIRFVPQRIAWMELAGIRGGLVLISRITLHFNGLLATSHDVKLVLHIVPEWVCLSAPKMRKSLQLP